MDTNITKQIQRISQKNDVGADGARKLLSVAREKIAAGITSCEEIDNANSGIVVLRKSADDAVVSLTKIFKDRIYDNYEAGANSFFRNAVHSQTYLPASWPANTAFTFLAEYKNLGAFYSWASAKGIKLRTRVYRTSGTPTLYDPIITNLDYITEDLFPSANDVPKTSEFGGSGEVVVAYSNDGTFAVAGGAATDGVHSALKVYEIVNGEMVYHHDVTVDGAPIVATSIRDIKFSPVEGGPLVAAGAFSSSYEIMTFSVGNKDIEYGSSVNAGSEVYAVTFNPSGNLLIVNGNIPGYARVYTVAGTSMVFLQYLYKNGGTTALTSVVYAAAFTPSGGYFFTGDANGVCKMYSVSGTTITYVKDALTLGGVIKSIAISPSGSLLAVAGHFADYAKLYALSGTTLTQKQIFGKENASTLTSVGAAATKIVFSPAGKAAVLCGTFTGAAKLYRIDSDKAVFLKDLLTGKNMDVIPSTSKATSIAYNKDGVMAALSIQSLAGDFVLAHQYSGVINASLLADNNTDYGRMKAFYITSDADYSAGTYELTTSIIDSTMTESNYDQYFLNSLSIQKITIE